MFSTFVHPKNASFPFNAFKYLAVVLGNGASLTSLCPALLVSLDTAENGYLDIMMKSSVLLGALAGGISVLAQSSSPSMGASKAFQTRTKLIQHVCQRSRSRTILLESVLR